MQNGKFVISLDFELMWGVRDVKTLETYGKNVAGVHQVIPGLLKMFREYGIEATFSTVGFLFFETKQDLLDFLPGVLPNYDNPNLSPYHGYLNTIGNDYNTDPYHFAPQLIKEIQQFPEQEIGTHTFSHLYCLEPGQTKESFLEDIRSAKKAATKYHIELRSLIFPRNQMNEEYLKIIWEQGIICYRGNEHSWLYAAKDVSKESRFRRAIRLLDAYINISGHNCYTDDYMKKSNPVNIPSSRFLRPYSKKLRFFNTFKLRRIKTDMTYAAKNNLTYHLWWHPHNFGIHQEENFHFLEKILQHYRYLQKEYQFQSITMTKLAEKLLKQP
jgi:hypothetical protein